MKNQFDTRVRSAHDVVSDLRFMYGLSGPANGIGREPHTLVAILGSNRFSARDAADALVVNWGTVIDQFGFEPMRVLTGCGEVGAEKAARLAAKRLTGRLAVVFHRAELTYGRRQAEEIRDTLLAQEADALLLLTTGSKVCRHARERFSSRGKKVIEVEIS